MKLLLTSAGIKSKRSGRRYNSISDYERLAGTV